MSAPEMQIMMHWSWWSFGAGIWCGAWAVVLLHWLIGWYQDRMISREALAEQQKQWG